MLINFTFVGSRMVMARTDLEAGTIVGIQINNLFIGGELTLKLCAYCRISVELCKAR